MPNNGKIISWDQLEFKLAGSASPGGGGAGDPTYGYGGTATTGFAPNAIDTAVGIYLEVASSFDGTSGTWNVLYDGPGAPFGGYIVGGTGYQSASISAVLNDVLLYQQLTGASYKISWSSIDIYVNGAYDITLPGSAVNESSAGVGPNYVPIIGVPLDMTGGGGAGRANVPPFVYDPCAPGTFDDQDYETTMEGSIGGGWRFKEAGSSDWQTLPVTIAPIDEPGGSGCPFGLSAMDVIEASDTFGTIINIESRVKHQFRYEGRIQVSIPRCGCSHEGQIIETGNGSIVCYDECTGEEVPSSPHCYKSEDESASCGGRIRLVPDLTRAVRRHQTDYKAFWLRLPLPEVTGAASRSCTVDSVTVGDSNTSIVYPQSNEIISVVGDGTHAIEDFLAMPIYSPASASRSETASLTWDTSHQGLQLPPLAGCVITCPECPEDWESLPLGGDVDLLEDEFRSESVGFAFPVTVGPEGSYQWHLDDEFRYLGTWCNIHWHYLQWREDWCNDTAGLTFADYWGPGRQQWLYNPALPLGERRRTRTDLIGSACEESGHTPFTDTFLGGYRWLGCSRFLVRKPDIQAEMAPDATGTDRWTYGDFVEGEWTGSGSLNGTGAVLDVDTVKATMDTNSFFTAPFLYASMCSRVRFVAPTNVSSWSAHLVGVDGAETLVATAAGTYDLPRAKSLKYAGSWGIDNGMGQVDDLGTDTIPEKGISGIVMGIPEATLGFQLLSGWSNRHLRWRVVPLDDTQPVTVPYPVFIAPTVPPKMIWESGQVCAFLHEEGPLVRLGNWVHYVPGLGLLNPPLIAGAGYKSTIIDAHCQQRLIFEGRAHDDNLTTELSATYDSYEGQAVSVVDKFSISYPIRTDEGMPWAMVNTMAEGPPIANFPNTLYDETTWDRTDDYGLIVWDWAQEHRYLISDGDTPAHIATPSGEIITTVYADVPDGWSASRHIRSTDNLEGSVFKVVRDGKTWATVSPWRGYSCALWIADPASGANPFNLQDTFGRLHRVNIVDGDIRYVRSAHSVPLPGWTIDQTITDYGDCASPRLAMDDRSRLVLTFSREESPDEFDVWQMTSDDDGATWSDPTMLMAGCKYGTVATSPDGTVLKAAFEYVSGTSGPGRIKATVQRSGDTSASAPFYLQDEDGSPIIAKDDTFHVSAAFDDAARWLLVVHLESTDAVTDWASTDECTTFTQLT